MQIRRGTWQNSDQRSSRDDVLSHRMAADAATDCRRSHLRLRAGGAIYRKQGSKQREHREVKIKMEFKREQLLLYAVTNRVHAVNETLYDQVGKALEGGVTCVQLREKYMADSEFIREAVRLRELCHSFGVPLIINDNVNVALESGADGVHVGQGDRPAAEIRKLAGSDFIIGVTAKTVEQACRAQADGADYIGSGAVFPSPTKQGAIRITKDQLREICGSVQIPAVAIGGVSLDNMKELKGCGMAGFAVVSAVFAAEDIEGTARMMRSEAERLVD